jgi:uncharacterized membrane protein (UPF0127 family)
MSKQLYFILSTVNISVLLAGAPSITVEHAWTPQQISWGLMQRTSLPDNHGMLFHYQKSCTPNFWSFNCCIDLSVAFIDERKVIREIKPLYAYSEKMDPARPVNRLEDMSKYPSGDPIIQFFLQNAASCKTPIRYVLEMNHGWFEKNGIEAGDSIGWDVSTHTAFFKKNEN